VFIKITLYNKKLHPNYKIFIHLTLLTIIWIIFPALILMIIAISSFSR